MIKSKLLCTADLANSVQCVLFSFFFARKMTGKHFALAILLLPALIGCVAPEEAQEAGDARQLFNFPSLNNLRPNTFLANLVQRTTVRK
jgi:hypothetical protein